jgi:hypothetical protein
MTGTEEAVAAALQRLEWPAPQQVAAWRAMTPARRLELACQAYQFALEVVRLTERQRHPYFSSKAISSLIVVRRN